jgi:fatty acid desaturase
MIRINQEIKGLNVRKLSEVKSVYFQIKFIACVSLCVAFIALSLSLHGIFWVIPSILLGFMYAHAVELQHQCLHNTGYRSKKWNRIIGVLLGLPTLVSYSDYQSSHLEHHRLLGTPDNKEFFNYGYGSLTSLRKLIPHLFMLSHYRDVIIYIFYALIGNLRQDKKRSVALNIRAEYRLMAVFLSLMTALILTGHYMIALKTWFIPLLIAVPVHCLIELPEHIGCDVQTLDVLHNTRSLKAGWLTVWFVDGNNYHVEHHWLPSVPNDKFPGLHKMVAGHIKHQEISYWSFYKNFLSSLYKERLSNSYMWKHEAAATLLQAGAEVVDSRKGGRG